MHGEVHYKCLKPIVKIVFNQLFNLNMKKNVLPNNGSPYILIGHHVSAFDPIIINAYNPTLIHFLYAKTNDNLPIRSYFLKHLDMIPFSKNSADIKSIREIKKRIQLNQVIGIYPEGEASWTGETGPINPSIIKLIKMMKVDVYGVRYLGAYMSKPRWCKSLRKGQVDIETYKLFDVEEIKELSVESLYEKMMEQLTYNEFEWQEQAMIPFMGKDLAEYIERVLYLCPFCHSFNTLHSEGNHFSCTRCQSEFTYNEYGQIHCLQQPFLLDTIPKWYQYEFDFMKKEIENKTCGEVLKHENEQIEKITVFQNHKKTDIKIFLKGNELEFRDLEGLRVVPIKTIRNLSITLSYVVEFNIKNDFVRIEFERDSSIAVKLFYDMIKYIKEMK